MSLWNRPYAAVTGAASVANQTGLNVQAGQTGPLPALSIITVATETKLLSPQNPAVALSIAFPPGTNNEQTLVDVVASGYIKTTAAGTIALGLYADALTTVTAGNLLHKTATAVTQSTATAPFFIHAQLLYDSVSGKLTGKTDGMINNTIDPVLANSNVPTGISNNGNPVFNLSLSITSSGGAAGTPTTINVQRFSVG
jgi:hypothetical protein